MAAYEFTTLTCIPGIIHYNEAKIQLLDLPGIIEGAAEGRGDCLHPQKAFHACPALLLSAAAYYAGLSQMAHNSLNQTSSSMPMFRAPLLVAGVMRWLRDGKVQKSQRLHEASPDSGGPLHQAFRSEAGGCMQGGGDR